MTKVLSASALTLGILAGGVAGWHYAHPPVTAPTASTGGRMPLRFKSRRTSDHDSVDSRWPSEIETSSFVPSARTPTMTSAQRRASSSRTRKWIPSAKT